MGEDANCYGPVEDVDMEGGTFRTHRESLWDFGDEG